MTPAYIRSIVGMPRKRSETAHFGANIPKNANDHEQVARVHPAQPSYFVVVPATELGGSINVAVRSKIGTIWRCARFGENRLANWPTRADLTSF